MADHQEITRLLVRWSEGDQSALVDLAPLVYADLRRLARSYLRQERRGHTLQATALVHELFLRLVKEGQADLKDRAHFFGIAARAMRQILIAYARQHGALKRGGDVEKVSFEETQVQASPAGINLLALDETLTQLAEQDPLQARIVELRFFGGYTIKETATLVKRSPATVSREWELARIWLYRELQGRSCDA